jgi:hypothetical protein
MIAQATILILSAVSAVIAAPAPLPDNSIKVPLMSRRMAEARANIGNVDIQSYLTDLNRVLHKYGSSASVAIPSLLKRANEPLTDQNVDGQDELYYGSGTVGANTALGGTCLAAIAGADLSPTENLYVVGDSFLKNWYSIYSFNNYNGQPSVSFAAAAGNQ